MTSIGVIGLRVQDNFSFRASMDSIIPQQEKSCFCRKWKNFWRRRKRKNILLCGTFLQQ
jgi:hypothetical protein